jgi:hypothetical protein
LHLSRSRLRKRIALGQADWFPRLLKLFIADVQGFVRLAQILNVMTLAGLLRWAISSCVFLTTPWIDWQSDFTLTTSDVSGRVLRANYAEGL